ATQLSVHRTECLDFTTALDFLAMGSSKAQLQANSWQILSRAGNPSFPMMDTPLRVLSECLSQSLKRTSFKEAKEDINGISRNMGAAGSLCAQFVRYVRPRSPRLHHPRGSFRGSKYRLHGKDGGKR